MAPQCPAAYVRHVADWQALIQAASQRGWPVPKVYAVGGGVTGERAAALGRLEAAVMTGFHDALLLPFPGTLGNAARLMRLLTSCTRHGVLVSFVPASRLWPTSGGAGPPGLPPDNPLQLTRVIAR